MMVNLYLIRHAPVIGKKGVLYGDDAEIDLHDQSDTVLKLSSLLPSPDEADWYSSGVDRAFRSGGAVLYKINSDLDPALHIRAHTGFREQDFGELIGRPHGDIGDYVQFVDGRIYAVAPLGGETINEFIVRVSAAIRNAKVRAIENKKENIVVFCHGGTIRAAHTAINALDHENFIALDTPPLSMHIYDISSF